MKKIILIWILSFVMQNAITQNRATFFKDLPVYGPVKQIVEYEISDYIMKNDTLGYAEKRVLNFSKDGRQIDECYYEGSDSNEFRKYSYEYPDDSTISMNTYNRYGDTIGKMVFKFDKQHREKEIELLPKEGNKWIFTYDKKGNRIKEEVYNSLEKYIETNISYNNQNQEIEEHTDNNERGFFWKKMFYDQFGKVIKIETDIGMTESFSDFDVYHNWLTITRSATNGTPALDKDVTKRYIIYY